MSIKYVITKLKLLNIQKNILIFLKKKKKIRYKYNYIIGIQVKISGRLNNNNRAKTA
jgi:hypothetical protein